MGKKVDFSCVWREIDGHSTSAIKFLVMTMILEREMKQREQRHWGNHLMEHHAAICDINYH